MADVAAPASVLGFRAFARQQGWKPSYVTELKATGRLVLTEDGRAVRVAESLRLIADTRDPAKSGVRSRHAAARGDAAPTSPSSTPPAGEGDEGADDAPPLEPTDPLALRRAKAQAEREEALLRKALRDEKVELGELLPLAEVQAATADAVMVFRTALQNLPTKLDLVDERDRAVVADGIEHALEELARKFGAIGKQAA